jgi:hypothetical protein
MTMSIDFQQVREQVKRLGESAPQREQHIQALQRKAERLLNHHADRNEQLQQKVERAVRSNAHLRCAIPLDERLDTNSPFPELPPVATIIAADGSQINPNRHEAVDYFLINVGAIQLQHGRSSAPVPTIQSQLFYDEAMYTSAGVISEAMVALIRDQREREVLADLSEDAPRPVLTFTDGPIELWSEERSVEFSKRFEMYLKALSRLHKSGAATAGYVDKPRSDLVVRLLEVALLEGEQLELAGRERPLRGVTDVHLFKGLLAPGERSAVFGIQSRTASKYSEELGLHFFYLNVGYEGANWLVRVEIPAWVVQDNVMLNHLHAVLVHQCRIIGAPPYPYLLHRAHETAVVTREEKEQLEQMILIELRNRGVTVGRKSSKQIHKEST